METILVVVGSLIVVLVGFIIAANISNRLNKRNEFKEFIEDLAEEMEHSLQESVEKLVNLEENTMEYPEQDNEKSYKDNITYNFESIPDAKGSLFQFNNGDIVIQRGCTRTTYTNLSKEDWQEFINTTYKFYQ